MRKFVLILLLNFFMLFIISGCDIRGFNQAGDEQLDRPDSNHVILKQQTAVEELFNCNPDPNGEPWIAGGAIIPTDEELAEIPEYEQVFYSTLSPPAFPDKVNNAELKYMRPVFNQIGGSCAQAAGIGYQFTYEMNFLRDRDSNLPENRYPSNWTYNFVNRGSSRYGSWQTWGWNIVMTNGVPDAVVYGQDVGYDDARWPSDYNVYYSAMTNRVAKYSTLSVYSLEQLNTLKGFLYDHNAGENAGGVFTFCAYVTDAKYETLPNEKKILTYFGTIGGHAMTIVGYDDTIKYDYNNDGQYTNHIDLNGDGMIDVKDYEIGAFIMVNSWGTTYGNDGFMYVPYRLFCLTSADRGILSNQVYFVEAKKSHEVSHTLNCKIRYDKRNELILTTGVTTDLTKTTPDKIQMYHAFSKTYDPGAVYLNGSDDTVIELGLDLTSLLEDIETEKDFKIFLNIERVEGAIGSGEVVSASLIDYTDTEKEYSSSHTPVELSGSNLNYSIVINKVKDDLSDDDNDNDNDSDNDNDNDDYTEITTPFVNCGVCSGKWKIATIPMYVNSWSSESVIINGVNVTNSYLTASQLPAKQNGYYYIDYISSASWAQLEMK